MSGTNLVHLNLTEIAARISAHLRKLEIRHRASRENERSKFYHAGASRAGSRVSVSYISYQGSTNLTREEALHYLAGLDQGFEGRHYEYFRQHPVPAPEDSEVRFTALVKGDSYDGYYLYAVTKRTSTRVYGKRLGGGYSKDFLPRSAVLKLQATEEDLRRVTEAKKKAEARIHEATQAAWAEFEEVLRDVRGQEKDEEEAGLD